MENIRDWCISRQLWWGHRIPAWYGPDGQIFVAHDEAQAQAQATARYGAPVALRQDEDVLDTWFSSGLWPFSTLGWPDVDAADLKKFYPTTVMETGFDIIFFWVARMIFFGLHIMGEVPFKTVFLHAMVRDREGNKMSKTKGNVIDPLHMIDGVRPEEVSAEERETYKMLFEDFPAGVSAQGADALRFTLAVYAAQGRDIKLDVKRVEGYRAFLNKLWNASKFSLMHLEAWRPAALDVASMPLTPADRWILGRLQAVTERVTAALDSFALNEVAQGLYQFVWGELCDWYIELSKPVLYERGEVASLGGDAQTTRTVLAHVLEQTLRLLHPIIPFVTEEIWQVMPKAVASSPSICVAPWPVVDEGLRFTRETAEMELAIALISRIRAIRGETGVKPSAVIETIWMLSDDEATREMIARTAVYLKTQANLGELKVLPSTGTARPGQSATALTHGVELHIPLAGLIDVVEETARLEKALAKVAKDIEHVHQKLSNPRFVSNAPQELVDKEKARLAEFEARQAALETSLQGLRGLS
jgi:valyl-tRNA synthetase